MLRTLGNVLSSPTLCLPPHAAPPPTLLQMGPRGEMESDAQPGKYSELESKSPDF